MNRYLNIIVPVLLFLFVAMLLPSLPGMMYDIGKFREWALYIHQHGLRNAYGNTDYMPFFQYCLWLYVKLMGSEQAIADHVYYLRCITLLFDFAGLWYVFKWINRKYAYFILLTICILNIGYSYDSLIWGQIDGILSALVLITIYYGWKGNNMLSTIFLVLAFNCKVQAIIIIPVWGLLFLSNINTRSLLKTMLLPIFVATVVQFALVLPFTMGEYGLDKITAIVTNSFTTYPSISVKASNMWHWFVKGKPGHGIDALVYASDAKEWILGLSYKQVGLILFFLSSLFALIPLLTVVYKNRRNKVLGLTANKELIWLTSAMVYMLFYFFNTEIHDRYCQPALIFITAYSFFTGRFLPYVLFSIMYLLTLEITMGQFRLPNYGTLIFDFRFLAAINAVIIVYLAQLMYKSYRTITMPRKG